MLALAVAACRPAPTSSPPPTATPSVAPPAVVVPAAGRAPATVSSSAKAKPPEPPWDPDDVGRIKAAQPLIRAAAAEYGVDANVMNAIIWHESKFNAKAKGPGGAAGLMQLMPTTSKSLAKRLGLPHRPYDAKFNVTAGAYLLSRLLKIFDGDQDLALAGYALGHVAVKRRIEAGEPLPERTQRFIAHVHDWSAAFAAAPELAPRHEHASRATPPASTLAP